MTAVQPARHRAPEDADTGSLGPIPAELRGRGDHHGRGARTGHAAPLRHAARTAGFSLAALGALAGAGGAASHGLAGAQDEQPAATGEFALPANLAAAHMAVPAAAPQAVPAAHAVMPVAAPAAVTPAPKIKTVAASSKQAVAKPAAKPAPAAKAAPAATTGAQALAAAKKEIGTPYVWGGTSPSGFDCSGLMQWAFEKAGKDLPRTSAAQSKVGQKVSMDDLQPGDMIFFNSPVSHVGMYAGNGMFLEAPRSGEDVKMSKLSKRMDDVVVARRV